MMLVLPLAVLGLALLGLSSLAAAARRGHPLGTGDPS